MTFKTLKNSTIDLLFVLFSFFILNEDCSAQFIEVHACGQQMKGDETKSSGLLLTVADNTMFGIGAGLNILNFNLNMDFLFGSTEVNLDDVQLDTQLFGFNTNLDYSLISGPISPMITAGIGSINFTDSFVQFEEINETNFSYNFGAGVRLVLLNHYLLKGYYRATWTKIKETDESIRLNGVNISLGYIF